MGDVAMKFIKGWIARSLYLKAIRLRSGAGIHAAFARALAWLLSMPVQGHQVRRELVAAHRNIAIRYRIRARSCLTRARRVLGRRGPMRVRTGMRS